VAGIGFALRKLAREDSLWSIFESQVHGVVVVAGPWFFTVLSMALPVLVFDSDSSQTTTNAFVTLLLYIFSFSLTLTSPIVITLTRHVSDSIHQKQTEEVAVSFIGSLLLAFLLMAPVVAVGMHYIDLPLESRMYALLAYAMITINWIAAPMISAIRQFRLLTAAYAAGTFVFWLHVRTSPANPDVAHLLIGFDLGMCITNAIICGLILQNFPGVSGRLFGLLRSFIRYWDLALSGLLYAGGIWVDKWLMWSAPERVEMQGGLTAFPTYDTVAFIAYITTVPALAVFIIKSETSFQQTCQNFYRAIHDHADIHRLRQAKDVLINVLVTAGRDVGILQVFLTILSLLVPTLIMDVIGSPHVGVFMFRFCALGAAFQLGVMLISIVLFYFDSRRTVLLINLVFIISNFAFTSFSLHMGFAWYGFGYFLASLLTFSVAYILVILSLRDLLYLAFVRQNPALTGFAGRRPITPVYFSAKTGPGPLDSRQGQDHS